jgi:hypothetical protein
MSLDSFLSPILDDSGFLRYLTGETLIWLPAYLRGDIITAFGDTIAVGGLGGAVTFVKKARHTSYE